MKPRIFTAIHITVTTHLSWDHDKVQVTFDEPDPEVEGTYLFMTFQTPKGRGEDYVQRTFERNPEIIRYM